jgi:exodeoxyribonuclease VII large subunit
MSMMSTRPLTVSAFIETVKKHLETNYRSVAVSGEITNFSISSSGHAYFSLTDGQSLLPAVMFKGDLLRTPGTGNLKDGIKVTCIGDMGLYAKRGSIQLMVKHVSIEGRGSLQEEFEKLKSRLNAEGLFDPAKKRKIPPFPKRVAIITAEGGAALQDFLEIYSRRCIFMDIIIVPTLVQGDKAPAALKQSLKDVLVLHRSKPIDVVVLARGGGSLEDLWAFNDESLCRMLAEYTIPTISAVGHQVDFCLTDYIADLRAETPSAAAQLLTEPQARLKERLLSCSKGLLHWRDRRFALIQSKIESLKPRYLFELLQNKINLGRRRLETLYSLRQIERTTGIHDKSILLDDLYGRMKLSANGRLQDKKLKLKTLEASLNALSPQQVLSRGFCYLAINDKIVSSRAQFTKLPTSSELSLSFSDGKVNVWKRE